ncbi:ATP-binding protein [Bernardetia sp. ABR2-2B]|uniref:NACHT domain-containing protein n=1 Tax=Bernardetia sp. ABR2-2B TaxID=3127472 RepID=UPI0030D2F024
MNRSEVNKYLDELLEKIAFFRKERAIVVESSLKFNLDKRIEETENKIYQLREFLKEFPNENFDSSYLEELSLLFDADFDYNNLDKVTKNFINQVAHIENSKNVASHNNFNNQGNVHIGDIYNSSKENKKLDTETVIKNLAQASYTLKKEQYQFHNLPNSHIVREETQKLLDFIAQGQTNKNVAFLVGEAGMGKTVITRDLYHSLTQQKIPCLAIKADRRPALNIEDLKKSLDLKYSFTKMFKNLSSYNNIVLIIDQIDALSQTLSNNREPLETYTSLIDSLHDIPNIKIIVSCRKYDLSYDTQLNKYQNRQQYAQFEVKKLKKEQVIKVLSLLNIKPSNLSNKLIDFLSTPLHLDVFCKVYKPVHNLLKPTVTLQELYDKLWEDKIDDKLTNVKLPKEEVTQLLKGISTKMYEKQTLTLKSRKYKNAAKSLKFLITENLLVEVENGNIQFFHQTFFDYVFARFFVESGKSLSDDLESRVQGLFTRSRVKQVINYLKYYDEDLYEEEVCKILSNDKIRFHIKLIIIELFSFYEDVLVEEKRIFNDIIAKNSVLCDKFLSKVVSTTWIEFLFENHTELVLKDDSSELLLARLAQIDAEKAIYFVETKYEQPNYNLIFRVANNIKDFSTPSVFSFLDKHLLDLQKDKYLYPKLIEKASEHNKRWAFERLYDYSLNKTEEKEYRDYHFNKLVKDMSEIDLEMSYYCCKKVVNKNIENFISSDKMQYFENDSTINYYDIYRYYPNRTDENYNDCLFNTMLKYLSKKTNEDLIFVKSEIEDLVNKKLKAYFIIILEVILSKPTVFFDETFTILSDKKLLEEAQGGGDYLGWQIRQLLEKTFHSYSKEQKNIIIKKIEQIKNKYGKAVIEKDKDGKREVANYTGFYKQSLISSIPLNELNNYPQLKRYFQELERLHGKFIDKKPSEYMVNVRNGNVALPKIAYEKMNLKQWKYSFKKYNEYESRTSIISRNEVNLEGNSDQFHNAIKENHKKFIPLILEIINDNNIHLEYKIKAVRALMSVEYDVSIIELLFKFINLDKNFNDTYFITDVYKYFFRQKYYNESLFQILSSYINTSVNSEVNDINSFSISGNKKGVGIRLLLKYGYNENYSERVFTLIQELALQNTPFIRMAIVKNIAYLSRYNREESLNIFVKLTKHLNYHLLETSIASLDDMIHIDFKKLIPFLEKSIEIINNLENDKVYSSSIDIRKTISSKLLGAWMENYEGAEKILFYILSKSQEDEMHTVINRCLKNIGENGGRYRKKSEFLLKKIIDEGNDIDKFHFTYLDSLQFDDNYNLLEYFTLSPACMQRNSGFYDYLKSCISDESSALKCLQLLINTQKHDLIRNYEYDYVYSQSVEVVIKCYNTIRNHSKNEKIINFALDAFDEELKRTNNQSEIDRVLELM